MADNGDVHPSAIPTVSVSDLPADAELLDVREDDEWQAGHAPNARHIPMNDVPGVLATDPDRVPSGRPLAVICKGGGRSAQVTAFLLGSGVEAVNVEGGMLAWARAERPMTAEDGSEPHVR